MEILLRRGLAAAAHLARCAMARVQIKIFSLPPRVAASLRLCAGLQPTHRAARSLLCADTQFAQLRALAHCQPGVEPRATQRLRRLHRAGLDRHFTHAECLSWQAERTHV